MDRKSLLRAAILATSFQAQCELLKAYFNEKRFAVLIRSERIAFSTFVTAVMVNSERFSQAKGKSKDESESKAVLKAWEKVISRCKHEEVEWLTEKVSNTKGEFERRKRAGLEGGAARRGRQRKGTATEPISPADSSEAGLASRERLSTPHKLDKLILAATKVVEKQRTPDSSLARKKKANGLKRMYGYPFRSLKPRLSLKRSPSLFSRLPTSPTKEESEESLSDEDCSSPSKAIAVQYRSLAEARFEQKVMRGRWATEVVTEGR